VEETPEAVADLCLGVGDLLADGRIGHPVQEPRTEPVYGDGPAEQILKLVVQRRPALVRCCGEVYLGEANQPAQGPLFLRFPFLVLDQGLESPIVLRPELI
jgi:hypothetical protein